MDQLIALEGVSKTFLSGKRLVPVLQSVSLSVSAGELCAIMGVSGSGKSTLMTLMGLLDRPSAGRLLFRGRDLGPASGDDLADIRNREIGFIFQAFHLLPRLSALDNVAMPLLYRGMLRREALARAEARLEQVGLAHRLHHLPDEMSGGQRQRVAVARALIGQPSILLADEPTGNLDSQSAQDIMATLVALNRDIGATVIIVTHDPSIATRCHRRILIRDGRLAEDVSGPC
ncbi:ABC transporter ATP-binding protein [Azospirillum argentinense]|uniref:ABC transporter ATP-binding protein n=1 Tax=Azospirillum argentinense TaxID=2970906 RepID=A0A2K1FRW5_9PROT|nr:ABC transporter ATP-binding protein [Azospirillum argentinense]PNQ95209.1 ABC transporter ATP-binding protein [Azospirillum argentinense]